MTGIAVLLVGFLVVLTAFGIVRIVVLFFREVPKQLREEHEFKKNFRLMEQHRERQKMLDKR